MDATQARQAAQVLKEHAPTKSHEVRRACMAAAQTLTHMAESGSIWLRATDTPKRDLDRADNG